MKKLLMLLKALAVFCFCVQATAFAERYNPYDDLYKAAARNERTPGEAQLVYVVIDANRTPLAGSAITYSNYQGEANTVVTNAQGKARLTFNSRAFVRLENLTVNGTVLRIVGKDTTESIDMEDVNKGDVEYFVLVADQNAGTVQVYDAS